MNKRELDVLNILFAEGRPLISAEIMDIKEGLTQSTVITVLRKLESEGQVVVVGKTHSGKVLSRQYIPTEKAKKTVEEYYTGLFYETRNILSADDLIRLAERIR